MEFERNVMTVRELAAALHISTTTVHAALQHRRLRGFKIGGRGDWRIEAKAVNEWIAAGCPTAKLETTR